MLKPEQIRYVMEWAESGNEPRSWREIDEVSSLNHDGLCERCQRPDPSEPSGFRRLNSAGLTIAALGAALVQANETAEYCAGYASDGLTLDEWNEQGFETMRDNLKGILG